MLLQTILGSQLVSGGNRENPTGQVDIAGCEAKKAGMASASSLPVRSQWTL